MFGKLWLQRAKLFTEITEKAEFDLCWFFPLKKNSFQIRIFIAAHLQAAVFLVNKEVW